MERNKEFKKFLREALNHLFQFTQYVAIRKERGYPVHIVALRPHETIFIRLALGEITKEDKKILEEFDNYPINSPVTKEIWVRKEGVKGIYKIWLKKDGTWRHSGGIETKARKRRAGKAGSGIYFVLDVKNQMVKIGYSINVSRRLSELRSYRPDQLQLLKWVPTENLESIEKRYHDKFRSSHIKGEWFKYSKEIKSFIKEGT